MASSVKSGSPFDERTVTTASSIALPLRSTTRTLTWIGKSSALANPSAGEVISVCGSSALRTDASSGRSIPPTINCTCKVIGLVALPEAALKVTEPEYLPASSPALFTNTFTDADPVPEVGLTESHDPPVGLVVMFVVHPKVVEPITSRLTASELVVVVFGAEVNSSAPGVKSKNGVWPDGKTCSDAKTENVVLVAPGTLIVIVPV